jgi:DNA-directed RNA polymerase specialized sigma24 family protein
MAAFLKYAFDCSNAEIAERLEIPASSIASVIARGRKKFQANETLANLWEQLFELELS